MKIALLGHSHHQVTRSAEFLVRILATLGDVETYFDESWMGCRSAWVDRFDSWAFDCIVVFQAHECFDYIKIGHPNIVFVPMYDAMIWQGAFYWREVFNSAKILCFSSTLNQEVSQRYTLSKYFQYFPDPSQFPAVTNYETPRGYYWRRRKEINNSVIERLTKGILFDQFTLQDSADPGTDDLTDSGFPKVSCRRWSIRGWNPSEADHLGNLSNHNIFFSPRIREGIGFSFLKAMAMGLCVVAPNTATHNEYISQGCTGLLYSPDEPVPADFSRYREMGSRARESIGRGRRRWESRSDEFLDFFATPTSSLLGRRIVPGLWIDTPNKPVASITPADLAAYPSVAVVTVCLNAQDDVEKTIRSVVAQDYPNLEYLVFDGGSNDGTIDVVRRYESSIAYWTSAPDSGVYPAMQQSLNRVRSEWVLFMNAGDFFFSPDALRRLFRKVPKDADVVFGHHVFQHKNGAGELRLACDFGWMWRRLREGNFNVEYPEGFPSHQATSVRTQLLRELKFDPSFQIAADHELLWRAYSKHLKFFNADEVVSVYVGGGFSAQSFVRCKQEWCMIAFRYGPRKGAPRFQNCTYTDAVGAVEFDYGQKADRTVQRVQRTFLRHVPGLVPLTQKLSAAFRWAARKYFLHEWDSLEESNGVFRFTSEGRTRFLVEAYGLAEPEAWGSWSEGDKVELTFREPLPRCFSLAIHACGFGKNASSTIRVTVGGVSRNLIMKGRRIRMYRLFFDGVGDGSTMTFSIPHPTAPASLRLARSDDQRRLGLGFVSMRLGPGMPPR